MPEEISFGRWLRQRRRTLDLTQKALAELVGCAEITVRRMEADAYKPSSELAFVLFEKLGVSESERPQWVAFARGMSDLPTKQIVRPNKPKSNLPASLTSFIGREKEQAEVITLIGKHRLVTLTGSGGVGKTRFALRASEQLLENYPDGVWWIELASLSDSALLPQTVAALFGLKSQSGVAHIDLLINFLRAKSALLILDNCEHLLDACAHLSETLLKSCPYLKILVTSREPLNAMGEARYRIPSLRIPDHQGQFDSLKDFESVRLFEERAQLIRFGFCLTPDNASAIAQICRHLNGIPLAIELAAAKIGILSPAQIAEQLEESLSLLTGGSRTALPRHQTLRASMDWSWNLLSQAEQMLMRQLSVFAGGWTLEATQSVCGGNVSDLLHSLVAKSLIVMKQVGHHDIRYTFHEIIRQYAHEKLIEAGENNVLCDRHLKYFLNLAKTAEPHLFHSEQLEWLAKLDTDYENLRMALAWSFSNNAEAGLQLVGTLWWFWRVCGYVSEGCEWMSKMLTLPDTVARSQFRAKALYGAAFLESIRYDSIKAHALYKESLSLYTDLGDKLGIANALNGLGFTLRDQSGWKAALNFFEKALKIGYEIENKHVIAVALEGLGLIARQQHNWIEAQSFFEQFLATERELGNKTQIAIALFRLGSLAFAQGDTDVARIRYEESLSLYQELDFKQFVGILFNALGEVARYQGDDERALILYSESLALFQEQGVGFENNYVTVLINMGYVACRKGHYVRAMNLFEESLLLSQKLGDEQNCILCLIGIAGILGMTSKSEQATLLFGAVESLKEKHGGMESANQKDFDRFISVVRAQLEESVFNTAWTEGQKMSLDGALDLALTIAGEM